MAGSSDGMLEALQAGIDALEDDEPTVAPLVTIETLAERIAHLDSPALQDDTPASKPKLPVAFATGPPLVGSPELVDLSSIASPVACEASDDDDDEEEAGEDGQSQSDAEATEPKQKPNGSDPTPYPATWSRGSENLIFLLDVYPLVSTRAPGGSGERAPRSLAMTKPACPPKASATPNFLRVAPPPRS